MAPQFSRLAPAQGHPDTHFQIKASTCRKLRVFQELGKENEGVSLDWCLMWKDEGGTGVPSHPCCVASPRSERENPFCSPQTRCSPASSGIAVDAGTSGGDGDKDVGTKRQGTEGIRTEGICRPQETTGLGVLKLWDRVGRKSGDKEFK